MLPPEWEHKYKQRASLLYVSLKLVNIKCSKISKESCVSLRCGRRRSKMTNNRRALWILPGEQFELNSSLWAYRQRERERESRLWNTQWEIKTNEVWEKMKFDSDRFKLTLKFGSQDWAVFSDSQWNKRDWWDWDDTGKEDKKSREGGLNHQNQSDERLVNDRRCCW